MGNNFINLYCDESCHLINDNSDYMVLGTIWVENDNLKKISEDIKAIKIKHNRLPSYEIKWTRIYSGNVELALEIIRYFFNNENLNFRGLIANKKIINHNKFNQTHDDWYFKMYYAMLKQVILQNKDTNIYFDIKDSISNNNVRKIKDYFINYQHSRHILIDINSQVIRSNESHLMQITDIFIGALRYVNQELTTSNNKIRIINEIKTLTNLNLKCNTSLYQNKFNLFFWDPKEIC